MAFPFNRQKKFPKRLSAKGETMFIEILQTHKLLATCEEALAARYTVHKLHEAPDKDALLAELRDRVRGIAAKYLTAP